jgi:hypothetical protein
MRRINPIVTRICGPMSAFSGSVFFVLERFAGF